MIPRFKPNFGTQEFLEIFKYTKSNQVKNFEIEFAALTGQAHGLSFSYGRMALLAYLKAEGFENKEIICPAYTCIVVAHAIEKSGNQCVFADINSSDLLMNFENLQNAISEKTAAIVFTSLFGNPVREEDVIFIRKNYPKIKIIQDCTHSIDENVNQLGDVSIYGLGLSKPITSIFGGMLTTNQTEIFEKVKSYRDRHFFENKRRDLYMRVYLLLVFVAFNPYFYSLTNFLERHGFIDYFVKLFDKNKIDLPDDGFHLLSTMEASIGRIQIKKFPSIKSHNRQIYKIYNQELRSSLMKISNHSQSVVSHYNILVNNRELLMKKMLSEGVQLGDMYEYSLPELPPYKGHRFCQNSNQAGKVASEILNLPLCVSPTQAVRIASLINKFA